MSAEPIRARPDMVAAALRLLASNQLASWLGQGLVSATNFIVLLMVARWGSVEDVGYYAIGFSILMLATVAQDALVTRPYAIQMFKHQAGPEAHAYGALVFGLSLSAAIAAALGLAAGAGHIWTDDRAMSAILLALALSVPLALWREFARRFSFAHLRMHQALAVDAAASLLLLTALGLLGLSGWLSASTALLSIGLAGGTAGLVWFLARHAAFRRVPGAVVETARRSWGFGKWLLASQVALQLQGYAAHWVTLLIAGAAVTGVYSACLSIVALANPFLFGLFNVLTPKFVRILKDQGEAGLRRAALKDAALVGAIMGGFAILVHAFGPQLMSLLFPSKDFAGGPEVLSVLALSSAVAALGAPATIALSAAERGRPIAFLAFAAFMLGTIVATVLLLRYGLIGAVWGILLTEALGTLARWALFLSGNRFSKETDHVHG